MVHLLWKTVWRTPELKIDLSYDPAIPFLDYYPEELEAGSEELFAHLRAQQHYSQ